MFWKISVILVAMWVLRTLSSYAMNGFINILLVIAILILLLRLIIGRGVRDRTSSSPGAGMFPLLYRFFRRHQRFGTDLAASPSPDSRATEQRR